MLKSRKSWFQTLVQLEPGKPAFTKGIRAAIATVVPIAIVEYTGWSNLVWTAIGGFQTSVADSGGLYRTKANSMSLVAFGGAISLFVGTLVGDVPFLSVMLAFLWAFGCGLASIYSAATATASTLVAAMFLIALGIHGNLAEAFQRSGMFLIGALLAMFLALVLWPLRSDVPVRMAVGECYRQLALMQVSVFQNEDGWDLSLSQKRIQVRSALTIARAAISQRRLTRIAKSEIGQRLSALTEIADQLFISTAALSEVLASHQSGQPWEQSRVYLQDIVEQLSESCYQVATAISSDRDISVNLEELDRAEAQFQAELQQIRQAARQRQIDYNVLLVVNYTVGIATRLGQYMHAAADIASGSGELPQKQLDADLKWSQSPSVLSMLRDNLTLDSAMFRHALRLGVMVAVAVAIYTIFNFREGYWITLTVVVILKPYSGVTFLRGLQRVLGTVVGGIIAVILAAMIHSPLIIACLLFPLTVATLAIQSINYGLFAFFLTPQVILMDNVLHPGNWSLAIDRIENTAIGCALALIGGYLLWPDREHHRLPEQFATTIDANCVYFQVVMGQYLGSSGEVKKALHKARVENTNAEASFQRLLSEPHRQKNNLEPLISILASIHQFNYAVTTLAAHLSEWSGHHQLPGLEKFAQQIEDLLADLIISVRTAVLPKTMPKLEKTQQEIAARLQELHTVRLEEIAANRGDTPVREAVIDYTLVSIEVERITRIVTIMHSGISRMYGAEVETAL